MAACACKFTATIQTRCMMDLVLIVQQKQVIVKKDEVLQHAGCVLGSLGKYISPEPQTFAMRSSDLPVSLNECAAEVAMSLDGSPKVLSDATIALMLRMVQLLIAEYLK